VVSTRFSKWGCANATLFLWKGCQVQKILGTYAQSLQSLSTLPFTNTRMNTPILLPVTIYCTCQSGAAEITAPGSQPNIDTGKSAKQTSQAETLALNGGWHAWATTTILMRLFSTDFTKCFRNESESFSETKINFIKTEMFYLENICETKRVFKTKVKLFLFLKRLFCLFFSKKCAKQICLGCHVWATVYEPPLVT